MNVLGLFLAAALRRNAGGRPTPVRGVLEVRADSMRAAVVFDETGARVTREAPSPTFRVEGTMESLVRAIARPGLLAWWRLKRRGNYRFAFRALRALRP